MKRLFGLHRARYFGQAKTHAQLAMAAIGQNLLKAANKIILNPQTPAINPCNRINQNDKINMPAQMTARTDRCPNVPQHCPNLHPNRALIWPSMGPRKASNTNLFFT